MKSKYNSPIFRTASCLNRLSLGLATTFIALTFAHGAILTWDTVAGDGTIISDGDGTWTSGVGNWNDAGVDTLWAQTSATNGIHSAIFGGGVDGTYAINLGGPIGTQGITFNNSGYTLSATVARTITVTSTGTMLVAPAKSATIGNLVTVTRGADFSINGADAVAAGTLNIGSGGIVTTSGSFKLNLQADGSIVNVQSGGILKTSGGALTSTAMQIGGSVGASTVNVEAGGIMSTSAGGIRVGAGLGGTGFLNVSGSVATSGIVYVGYGSGSNGTLSINNGGTVDTSAGTFQMGQQGASTSTGRFNLNSGGTLFTKGVVLQSAATNVIKFDGGVLKAALDNTAYLPAVANSALNVHNGGVIFDSNAFSITVAGVLAHSNRTGAAEIDGGLTKSGDGTLTLTGVNTYNGPTTITGGSLQLTGNGSITASPTISIANGSTLIYNRIGAFTYGGIISGSGKVTKLGAATQTLTGLNSYTGDTTISAGVLVVNGTAIPDASKLILDGTGMVDLTGNETVNTLFIDTLQKAAGVYGSSASSAPLANQDDTRFSGTGILTVTNGSVVADPFSTWASANGLTAANNGANQDPDFDSVPNLVEFVLGGQPNPANPNSNSTGLLPMVTTASGNLVFTFTRSAQSKVAQVALTIRVGTDLVTFPAIYTVSNDTASSTAGVTVTPSSGNDIVTLTIPQAPDAKKFARLNAVYTP